MKKAITKYIAGYIIRFALGTALVLCAISAARIIIFSDKFNRIDLSQSDPWELALIYPDKLVNYLLVNYAPQWLPKSEKPEENSGNMLSNHAPSQINQPKTTPSLSAEKATADGQNIPGDKQTVKAPAIPDMPDISKTPATRTTSPAPVTPVQMPASGEWGLTADNRTPVYSMKGKRRTYLPAGKVFGIVEHRNTPKGEFLICTLPNKNNIRFVLRSKDVVTYRCDYNAVAPQQRDLCKQQAKIMAAITDRKDTLKKMAENRNPYAGRYKKVLAEYKQFAKKNNALLKAYNNATGSRRMELADKLRLLKDEGVRRTADYNAIKKQYTDWKRNNASVAPSFDQDPQIKALKQKLKEVENKLANP